ncbi:MAG: transcriptional repressor [Chloroflexi bacterium HGW-Chloroflexi-6]|nr:MAG: transcriptional repressor [Chloroflexi bacterium HGW-Chloroflexi-6]
MKKVFNTKMTETSDPIIYDQWLESLSESGYRVTAPRRAIVEIMANSPCALGPLEIYDQGRQEYRGLGLVTVYRTLEKLEELGLVQRVHHPQGCHMYLRAAHGHEHLVLCTACGKAEYFSGDDIDKLTKTVAEKTGFEIREHWLQLFGLCANCKNN